MLGSPRNHRSLNIRVAGASVAFVRGCAANWIAMGRATISGPGLLILRQRGVRAKAIDTRVVVEDRVQAQF
jgi:hypothetical protein